MAADEMIPLLAVYIHEGKHRSEDNSTARVALFREAEDLNRFLLDDPEGDSDRRQLPEDHRGVRYEENVNKPPGFRCVRITLRISASGYGNCKGVYYIQDYPAPPKGNGWLTRD